MATCSRPSADEVDRLRESHYNASVTDSLRVHEELMILRVRLDAGPLVFEPGQYSVLGLGNWEPRVPGCQDEEAADVSAFSLLKRAYSFSCPMLGDDGQLLPPHVSNFLEFYVVLIRWGTERPPGLTPRLFALQVGDRLFVGPKVTGRYTLASVREDEHVVFLATGTGEAPHNAMVAHLLARGHSGHLVSVTCARHRRDLAYLDTHRVLERRFSNYRYLPITTREAWNLDRKHPDYVGRRHLQEYLARGFRADEPGRPGNLHFETYW